MTTPITLSPYDYEILVALAISASPEQGLALRQKVDAANGLTRYTLQVRWRDVGGKTPPATDYAKGWPTLELAQIQLLRPITRTDVDELLRSRASNPAAVQVTPDPYGKVGWTYLDDFNFENQG
jgi:hypothetical protein